MPTAPRVFISYSHDSADHQASVLELAQRLRRDGIAAELDQFHVNELVHWPRWCEEQMRPENTDYVLCVFTAEYARRVEGKVAADVGKGVFWEATLIYNELYDDKGSRRCVALLLAGATDKDIPRILQNYTYFRLDRFGLEESPATQGYCNLYRLLTGQASVVGATVGEVHRLEPVPEGEKRTDFLELMQHIKTDTTAIRDTQTEHSKLLQRILHQAASYRRGVLHQLPSPPEHFTGRADEIIELLAALRPTQSANDRSPDSAGASSGLPGTRSVIISAVNGLGGVGKTALATMAAYALVDDYPDLQLFLPLRTHSPQPRTAEQARDSVLQALTPESRLPDDEDTRWMLYRKLFDAEDGKPCAALVVLDDVADDQQVNLLKPPPPGVVLVTSRRQLQSGQSLRLDRMVREDAINLLTAYAPRLQASQADLLAKLCGDLPVALRIAGGVLKCYPSKPVAEYLDELQHDRLEGLRGESAEDDVSRVFAASWRYMTVPEQQAFAALSIFQSHFGRDAGKAVIAAVQDHGNAPPPGDEADELSHYIPSPRPSPNPLPKGEGVLRSGGGLGCNAVELSAKSPSSSGRGVGVRGVESVATPRFDRPHPNPSPLGEGTVELNSTALGLGWGRVKSEASLTSDRPHLYGTISPARLLDRLVHLNLLEYNETTQRFDWHDLVREYASRQLTDEEKEMARLAHADYYIAVAERADELYLQGHEAVKQGLDLFDLERAQIETTFAWLSDTAQYTARLIPLVNGVTHTSDLRFHPRQQIAWLEMQLNAARQSGHRAATCVQAAISCALGNLGLAWAVLGETRKAIEYFEQAQIINREIGSRRDEYTNLNNLGNAWYLLGETCKAIDYYEQGLVIDREIGDRRGEGASLGSLGIAWASLGEIRKAIDYNEECLELLRETGDRRGEGAALGNLGNAWADLGENRKAIDYYEQQLVITSEIGDRRGEGIAMGNLGVAWMNLGETRKAIDYYEQALVIDREIGDRRGEGNDLFNSALVYHLLGETVEAIHRAEAALAICEAIEDPHAAMVRDTLAEWRG